MRKTLIIFICLQMCAGLTTAMAYETSEDFRLYSNNTPTTDETADEIAPENAPVGEGFYILIAMAGGYALRVYSRRRKESI